MKRLDTGARRAAVVVLVLAVTLFVLAAWIARHESVSALDHGVRAFVRDGRVLALQGPMRTLSLLGSGYVLLPVMLVCSAGLWRHRQRAAALALPLVGAGAAVALALTKWIINKPRPSLRGYGFPSGHVFGVTVFVMIAVYLLWRLGAPRRWRQGMEAGGAVFVLAVGYSRLYVGAHWLSDVVGGLLAGLAFAMIAMLLMDAGTATRPPTADAPGSSGE